MSKTASPVAARADIPDLDIEIDGIAELWWDDAEAMKASVASPEAQALFADGALFIGRIKTYVIKSPSGDFM